MLVERWRAGVRTQIITLWNVQCLLHLACHIYPFRPLGGFALLTNYTLPCNLHALPPVGSPPALDPGLPVPGTYITYSGTHTLR